MNRYIITEEHIKGILNYFAEEDNDELRFAAYDIITTVKSNPYHPPERDILATYDSKAMIGNVKERFEQLERKGWDWSSFYNGWLEGRAEIYSELRQAGEP
jgi:hypothetical protein